MADAFFSGVFVMYIASGMTVLGIVCYRRGRLFRWPDIGFAIGTILVWPLFVDRLFKKLFD